MEALNEHSALSPPRVVHGGQYDTVRLTVGRSQKAFATDSIRMMSVDNPVLRFEEGFG